MSHEERIQETVEQVRERDLRTKELKEEIRQMKEEYAVKEKVMSVGMVAGIVLLLVMFVLRNGV